MEWINSTRPEEYISPSVNTGLPWVFFEIDEELKFDEQSLSVLYEWIQNLDLLKIFTQAVYPD